MPVVYKLTIGINRCCCNLIFAYRYKTINTSNCVFAAKRAYWFLIGIIVVLQAILDCFYFTFVQPKLKDCFSHNLEVEESNDAYIYAPALCYLLTAIFQTIILVEIIMSIFYHCTRLNNSTISNNSIRSTLYRIVLTTLVFCLSDFADIIAHVFRAALLQTRSPMMIVINLSINTLTLMCSYEDYRMRIFPFICSFKPTRNNLGKAQVNQRSSENGRATNYMKD